MSQLLIGLCQLIIFVDFFIDIDCNVLLIICISIRHNNIRKKVRFWRNVLWVGVLFSIVGLHIAIIFECSFFMLSIFDDIINEVSLRMKNNGITRVASFIIEMRIVIRLLH